MFSALWGCTFIQSFWRAIWKFLFKSKKHTDCSYPPSCCTSRESTSNINTRRFSTTLSHVKIKCNPNVHLRKELETLGYAYNKKYCAAAKKFMLFLCRLKWIHCWVEKERTAEWYIYNNIYVKICLFKYIGCLYYILYEFMDMYRNGLEKGLENTH